MAKTSSTNDRLKLMVSSTVYGIEPILEQVYALLTGFGYEVWMSMKGTVPVLPDKHALESCLAAAGDCDLLLAIITPHYGSGVVDGDLGITHQELEKAIRLKKPRWILAHDRVIFARSVFRKLGCKTTAERDAMLATLGFDSPAEQKKLLRREQKVIDDFRVIDMYNAAIRQNIANVKNRIGNWVQPFVYLEDVKRFVTAQFHDHDSIKSRIAQANTPARKRGRTRKRSHK